MAFTLTDIPGLIDLPDAVFTQNLVLNAAHLREVNFNANLGAVCPEIFFGEYLDGEAVALPTSTVTGYQYARAELRYIWVKRYSADKDSKKPSAPGDKLLDGDWVHPATGEVHVLTSYYQQGGNQSPPPSNDGVLAVWTIAVEGWPNQVLAIEPTHTDIDNADLALDKPAKQTLLRQINANAKLAGCRFELFSKSDTLGADGFPLSYKHGDTVPVPTGRGGHVYTRAELLYLPFWIYTGKYDRSGPSGGGRMIYVGPSAGPDLVDATTGVVGLKVDYWDGHNTTPTTDGLIGVLVVGQRDIGVMAPPDPAFVEVDSNDVNLGELLTDALIQQISDNAKSSILRPEAFSSAKTHGQTVATPTSPVSGHVYVRADCIYIYSMTSTGGVPAPGAIRDWDYEVDQATGLVSSLIHYGQGGGTPLLTHNGVITVLTLAFRDGAPLFATIGTGAPTPAPLPPAAGDGNLIFNGGFELWADPANKAADWWTQIALAGNADSGPETGLIGDYAQGLEVGTPGAGNGVGVESPAARVTTGMQLAVIFLTKASVAIASGFYGRIKFYNSDFSDSVYITPWSNAPVAATQVYVGLVFVVPANGDVNVLTSAGSLPISGTLDFAPAFMVLELEVSAPNLATVVSLDGVFARDISSLLPGTLDEIPHGITYKKLDSVSASYKATTASITSAAVNTAVAVVAAGSLIPAGGAGGGAETQIATLTITTNGGYVHVEVQFEVVGGDPVKLEHVNIHLYKGAMGATEIAVTTQGFPVTAQQFALNGALFAIDVTPGASQQYTVSADDWYGTAQPYVNVTLIAENRKV